MIRFACPDCKTRMEALDEEAGGHMFCPECGLRCPIPSPTPLPEGQPFWLRRGSLLSRATRRTWKFFAEMGLRVRLALLVTAGACLTCFVLLAQAREENLAVSRGEKATRYQHALVIGGSLSLVAFLVVLYGYATSCPSCHRLWARNDAGNDLVDSELYYKDGDGWHPVPEEKDGEELEDRKARAKRRQAEAKAKLFLRVVTYHYKHQCSYCGHQWITRLTLQYQSRHRRKLHRERRRRRRRRAE
ncbi:MAG TPA: hypothetical protein VNK04_09270 [Gemmataceae bacterium]|nr:hypothetical protein [Gemmataceae bacterium]